MSSANQSTTRHQTWSYQTNPVSRPSRFDTWQSGGTGKRCGEPAPGGSHSMQSVAETAITWACDDAPAPVAAEPGALGHATHFKRHSGAHRLTNQLGQQSHWLTLSSPYRVNCSELPYPNRASNYRTSNLNVDTRSRDCSPRTRTSKRTPNNAHLGASTGMSGERVRKDRPRSSSHDGPHVQRGHLNTKLIAFVRKFKATRSSPWVPSPRDPEPAGRTPELPRRAQRPTLQPSRDNLPHAVPAPSSNRKMSGYLRGMWLLYALSHADST
jgi:hypothetical protein